MRRVMGPTAQHGAMAKGARKIVMEFYVPLNVLEIRAVKIASNIVVRKSV